LIGISHSTYNKYEKAKSNPSSDILLKIAQHFKVSLDDLLTKTLTHPIYKQSGQEDSLLSKTIRILPVTITNHHKKNIEFVYYKI